jgi:hypothetical protein
MLISCCFCNKNFNKKQSSITENNYCSKDCFYKHLKNKTKAKRLTKCQVCDKSFYPEKKAKYCSRFCYETLTRTEDYDKKISDEFIECIDGFLLGDGHITKKHCKLQWHFKYEEFSNYITNLFKDCYITQYQYSVFDKRTNKYYTKNSGRSRCFAFLKEQRKRWYPEGKKIVPKDIRFTPKLVMLWYLGDGYLQGVNVYLSTMCFSKEDNEFLCEKFKQIGIKAHISKHNSIYIKLDSVREFFKYIGKNEVTCYNYKFNIPEEIVNSYTISELATQYNNTKSQMYYKLKNKINKTKGVNNAFWYSESEVLNIIL